MLNTFSFDLFRFSKISVQGVEYSRWSTMKVCVNKREWKDLNRWKRMECYVKKCKWWSKSHGWSFTTILFQCSNFSITPCCYYNMQKEAQKTEFVQLNWRRRHSIVEKAFALTVGIFFSTKAQSNLAWVLFIIAKVEGGGLQFCGLFMWPTPPFSSFTQWHFW